MYAISLGLRADDYYAAPRLHHGYGGGDRRYLKIDSPISKMHFIAESANYWGEAGPEATRYHEKFIQFRQRHFYFSALHSYMISNKNTMDRSRSHSVEIYCILGYFEFLDSSSIK